MPVDYKRKNVGLEICDAVGSKTSTGDFSDGNYKSRHGGEGTLIRIFFRGVDGERRAIHLGRTPIKVAEEWARKISAIEACLVGGISFSAELAAWLRDLPEQAYTKLSHGGLVLPREAAAVVTLEHLVKAFIDKAQAGAATIMAYKQTLDSLLAFYGPKKPITEITSELADNWRSSIAKDTKGTRKKRTTSDNRLAPATVAKRVMVAKQVFKKAVRWNWITKSPFEDMRSGSQVNAARLFYVSTETIEAVLNACSSIEWKVIVGLCRYAGLRCPSEVGIVTWADVNWEKGRLTVLSKKTEHHGGDHAVRVVPIQPALHEILREAFEQASEGSMLLAPKAAGGGLNLRTTFKKIVARAGCKPWPRLFQNLRASCETDWVEKHPAHECAAWMGHSPAIASAHYLQARNHHFEAVVNAGRKSDAESDARTAQNRAQQASATLRQESQNGIETDESSGVITVLPNKTAIVYKRTVGEEGLEPPTLSV